MTSVGFLIYSPELRFDDTVVEAPPKKEKDGPDGLEVSDVSDVLSSRIRRLD